MQVQRPEYHQYGCLCLPVVEIKTRESIREMIENKLLKYLR
jgi:hypothetical protein